MTLRDRLKYLTIEEETALRKKLGLTDSGLSCLQVFDFFMMDDEDDSMHRDVRPVAQPPEI